jgi:tetratricopeptide (TPR) repeat protein
MICKKPLFHVLLTTAFIFCANIASPQNLNDLPKYGSLPKEEWQKAADANFISSVDDQYHGDRKKASTDYAARGWQFLAQQNFEDAMHRFNQAWLLNNKNGIALWGMAAIESSSGKFESSLKLFAEAEELVGSQLNFSIDYAKALGKAGAAQRDDTLLKDAFGRFEHIYQQAPQNTLNLQNWAITLFSIGRYSEAWAKVKLAEASPNNGSLDPRFVAALESRMPRPKN